MSRTQTYTVQPCITNGGHSFEIGETVEAASPLEAARLVLGEELSFTGSADALRARVLRLDNFALVSVYVFTKPLPPSTDALRE